MKFILKFNALRSFWRVAVLLVFLWPVVVGIARGQVATEYQIKAAFLYNFIKFVQWPAEAFAETNSPVVIGILGEDPFRESLVRVSDGKTVGDRKVVVKHSHSLAELKGAHLLFVSRSEQSRLRQILRETRMKPVLTVSESDSFCERGGIINFVMRDEKVRFEINPDAARTNGLRISSKLLSLATIVPTESSGP